MPVNSFNPSNVWKPFGAFSIAVAQGSGQVLHLKGQVSLNSEGAVIGESDIELQVETTLKMLQKANCLAKTRQSVAFSKLWR